ncbi:Uncharacterised protein [Burkholderia pseudomallei]|uniref:hypothetical protein n=1 Tax=Burkholderia pseudomallei TaxID=28450 RepID=UPI00025C2695|nr:hypothetical protein [Burkholderia pseudomallei]ARL49459.1 hypothetical protein BOC51_05165 [Burkholderia pseudomallei]EIF70917.1 hypothetical protein BP354E_4951 [Burkholderia pseudomallei 354e]EIF73281.1 hypothetical protein BP354A_5767 [Burkholderia pseudomallei 354a]MBF3557422.1 hypothetical protein [Burkholderia pseudomallei]MDY7816308.1 hypothetical protein [Burkholderia pseudomallei]
MTRWLDGYEPIRKLPRLWVETVWLVESREPLVLTRAIKLHPGLNIVWAKEPTTKESPGLASAGHGVGKTSLCLLMRYVLGDDAPAIATLREKAVGSFPKGGVAAKVHVEGATWLVFRPYGAYSHSLASQCDELEPLLRGDVPKDFSQYINALEQFSIGRLAVQSLPGTNQAFKWRHLLAWCIRDQRTRFDGFYHWRDGEGLGFTRPRRDPPLFVGSVLGLVEAGLDRLLREIESKQIQLDQAKERIPELERAPAFALAHAERQLRIRLGAGEDESLHETTVDSSVESRVRAVLEDAKQEEDRLELDVERVEEQLAQEQIHLASLNKALQLVEVEVGIAKSLVDTNRVDFERLTTLRDQLEGLDGGRCEHGDVEFSACQHIQNRKSSVSMTWHRDGREVRANASELARQLTRRESEFRTVSTSVAEQLQRISSKKAELRRLRIRIATSESSRALLQKSWDELQLLHLQRAHGVDSADLVQVRKRLHELEAQLNSLRASVVGRRSQQSSRIDAIKSLTTCVSTRLLGAAGHARFVPGHEVRPFEVSRGGEAYQVLEVLLGDIVCLLDSALSDASNHPGFLVHDCPREADMSERLYREFFLVASEAAEQLGEGGAVPFQFIVTTTSPPPEDVHGEPSVVLVLGPGSDEKLLFKRELVPELPGFE